MTEQAKNPTQYPCLRNLQFSPLKEQDEQYVLLWDPTRISSEKLIIPMSYFFIVQHFDGEHSLEQIGVLYLKKFGEFLNPDNLHKLVADLDEKLFLEGERFETAKVAAQTAYRNAPVRKAAHAGKSYPDDRNQLHSQVESFYTSKEGPEIKASENSGKPIRGLVAPHYEMKEAGPIYAWGYKELQEAQAPDLFVILGTCQSGLERLFALTDKDFETPLGIAPVAKEITDQFRTNGQSRFFDEELAHLHDHTIEFQLPFIQHALGHDRPFRIVPVLCSFPTAYVLNPEFSSEKEHIDQFISTLKKALATSGKTSCIVASAELAHLGMRYGDAQPPSDFSFHRCMQHDLEMLKHVEEVHPEEFAQFIAKEGDSRKIWGFAPIYTLLQLLQGTEGVKGQVLRYDRGITDQFNSTVTYASISFF